MFYELRLLTIPKSEPKRRFCLVKSVEFTFRMLSAGGPADTRRQRVRHDRQTGPPGRADRTVQESDVRGRPGVQANVFVPHERLPERQKTNAIRRPEGTLLCNHPRPHVCTFLVRVLTNFQNGYYNITKTGFFFLTRYAKKTNRSGLKCNNIFFTIILCSRDVVTSVRKKYTLHNNCIVSAIVVNVVIYIFCRCIQVVLVQGHYLSYLPLCSRNEPVFLATCSPVAMPETREAVVQGSTTVFTAIHSMDMKFMHVDKMYVLPHVHAV